MVCRAWDWLQGPYIAPNMAGDETGPRCNCGIQSRAEGAGATAKAGDKYIYAVAQARFKCSGLHLYVIPGSMDGEILVRLGRATKAW